jgi:YVTN family beta-propeller protein
MRRSTWQFCFVLLLTLAFAARANDARSNDPRANEWSNPAGILVVANQGDHTLLVLDLAAHRQLASVVVGVNGHEVAVSPDGKFAYVPIYGNSGVGKPGTDGRTIDIVDLHSFTLAGSIDLGKPVRPHCAKFGPDGLLYVSAELSSAIFAIDPATRKVVAEIPTGAEQSHMFVISPDGTRAYTANVSAGSVSVLDLQKRSLITVIPVAKIVQRISVSRDGRWVFTHDQDQPRIAVIDTATNKFAKWIEVASTVYSSAVTPDNTRLVALSPGGSVFVIDLAQFNVVSTVAVPQASGEIIVSPDGKFAFASCPGAASIQVIDLRSGKLLQSYRLTKGVDGLDWIRRLSL